jgi:hypothetical protein
MGIRIASIVLSLAGVFALILGVLFWTGIALNLIALHMLLGLLAIAALWVIAVGQAMTASGSWMLAAAALVVGALTALIGWTHSSLMPGEFHWVIRVVHVVLGVLTIGLGHMAVARTRRAGAKETPYS